MSDGGHVSGAHDRVPGFGFYPRSGFIHIDLGPAPSSGRSVPEARVGLRGRDAAGARGARGEPDAEGRGLRRCGDDRGRRDRSGSAAQQVLAETQDAVLPLVPYLDTLRWAFIAIALAGIAVAIYARIDDWKNSRR